MSKIGLICEGGGTKAAYTAGVLECFLNEGIDFSYTAGISAGAMCLTGFISKQKDRLRVIGIDSTSQKEAVGLNPLLHEHSVFGINATYDFIEKNAPLDMPTFLNNPCELEMGLYNIENGKIEYYGKEDYDLEGKLLKASCALLMLTKSVEFNGKKYMDGGLVDMIPIDQALRKGCDKVIFISTKEANYVRKPAPKWQLWAASLMYRKQKHIRNDLSMRHENYQKQWQKVKEMEREGKAIILRPSCDMGITRYTHDKEKLTKWYELGVSDTLDRMEEIRQFFND